MLIPPPNFYSLIFHTKNQNNNNLSYNTYNVVSESQLRKDFVPPLKKLGAFVITDHSNDTVKVSFKK